MTRNTQHATRTYGEPNDQYRHFLPGARPSAPPRTALRGSRIENAGATTRTPFEYRWEHVQAVVRLAIRLAERTGADREVCEAAAWLHDVAKAQLPAGGGSAKTTGAMERPSPRAASWPRPISLPHKIEAVADAIAKHVGLSHDEPVEPLEAAVLWDADKLTKLGATIVLHGVGYLLAEGTNTTGNLIAQLEDEGVGGGHRGQPEHRARAGGGQGAAGGLSRLLPTGPSEYEGATCRRN